MRASWSRHGREIRHRQDSAQYLAHNSVPGSGSGGRCFSPSLVSDALSELKAVVGDQGETFSADKTGNFTLPACRMMAAQSGL